MRVLALSALLLLAGCGDRDADEATLTIDAVEGSAPRLIRQATTQGLTSLDDAGQVVPGLARSWRVSEDGQSIIFRLRAPEVAQDAMRAIDGARRNRQHPFNALLAGVRSVGSPAEGVVELRLTTPQPELLELLAQPELAPADAGAFIAERAGASSTRLRRRADFPLAATVPLASLTVRASETSDAVARFVRGESDLVLGGRLDGFVDARTSLALGALRLSNSRATLLLLVNSRAAPLKDPEVRRALNLALDRTTLGAALYPGAPAPALHGLTPAGLPAFPANEPGWAAEPLVARQQRARDLLEAAGITPDKPVTLRVAVPDQPVMRTLTARLAADWQQMGVRLVVETRRDTAHAALLRQGGYQLAVALRETPYASPLPLLLPLQCGATRGPCLPDADRQLRSAWEARSVAERSARYAEAERLWIEAGAVIPLVQPLSWALVGERVAGWQDNAADVHPLTRLDRVPDRRLFR